jgi:hypothetical protein
MIWKNLQLRFYCTWKEDVQLQNWTWLHMPEAQWLEDEADHSSPLSDEVKNMQRLTSKLNILIFQW